MLQKSIMQLKYIITTSTIHDPNSSSFNYSIYFQLSGKSAVVCSNDLKQRNIFLRS